MIKEIIVDLGGVYFTDGTGNLLQEIQKYVKAPEHIIKEIFRASPRQEGYLYRAGKISGKEFWTRAKNKLNISDEQAKILELAWLSGYKPIPGMKELVQEMRKHYWVIVFSGNIKERIMYLDQNYGLLNDFDDFIFSYDAGFNKGDKEIVNYLIGKLKYSIVESVYIDDRTDFLTVAEKLGFKTILFKSIDQLREDLSKLDIKFTKDK